MDYQTTVKIIADCELTIMPHTDQKFHAEDIEREFVIDIYDDDGYEFEGFEVNWIMIEEGKLIVNARIEAEIKRDSGDDFDNPQFPIHMTEDIHMNNIIADIKCEFKGLIHCDALYTEEVQ